MKQWAAQHIRGAAARFPVSQNHTDVLEVSINSLYFIKTCSDALFLYEMTIVTHVIVH